MIADKLLDILFGIVNAIISLLPSWDWVHKSAFGDLITTISYANEFFPVDTLAEGIIAYFAFSVLLLSFKPILKLGRIA